MTEHNTEPAKPLAKPTIIEREAQAAANLVREIIHEFGDDDHELIEDMIEGQTGLMESVDWALTRIAEETAVMEGARKLAEQYTSRAKTARAKIDWLRGAIHSAYQVAGLKRPLRRPAGTVTLKSTARKVEIVDETLIPTKFLKYTPPAPDEAAITKAMTAAEPEHVPGAKLLPAGTAIQITRGRAKGLMNL